MFDNAGNMQVVIQRTELLFNTSFQFVFSELVSIKNKWKAGDIVHTSSSHPSQQGYENWIRQDTLQFFSSCSCSTAGNTFSALLKIPPTDKTSWTFSSSTNHHYYPLCQQLFSLSSFSSKYRRDVLQLFPCPRAVPVILHVLICLT